MDNLLWTNFVSNSKLFALILSFHTVHLWKMPLLYLLWMLLTYLHLESSLKLPSSVLLEAPAVSI